MKIGVLIAVLSAMMVAGGVYKMMTHTHVKPGQKYPTPVYDAWMHWKQKNGKAYGTSSEEQYRLSVFYNNMVYIRKDYQPSNTYALALNKFADLSSKEFAQIYLKKMTKKVQKNIVELPEKHKAGSVDWRTKGAVTPVKDQGNCGSCWAFSTTGSLEGADFLANGKLRSFSEQQLVSCSKKQGNEGCNGGLMDYGMDYVKANGIELESTYPYTAKTGKCKKSLKSVFKISSYTDVKANNEAQFQAALAKMPVSIAINGEAIQLYDSGVFTKKCGTSLDHGVLAVAYTSGSSYTIKNSWGKSWGEKGYIRFGVGLNKKKGQCGMFMEPVYPTV